MVDQKRDPNHGPVEPSVSAATVRHPHLAPAQVVGEEEAPCKAPAQVAGEQEAPCKVAGEVKAPCNTPSIATLYLELDMLYFVSIAM